MKYLLDTNICAYIINKRPDRVFKRFKRHRVGDLGISVITFMELHFGVEKSSRLEQNRLALQAFVAPLEILPLTPKIAPTYGSIRFALEQKGKPIGPLDLQIAAHALCENLTLVSNNTSEFRRVPGLRVENWIRR